MSRCLVNCCIIITYLVLFRGWVFPASHLAVVLTKARFPLPELTAWVDGWPVSITRQHGPCWRACFSTSRVDGPSTRTVNTGRVDGPSVRVGRLSVDNRWVMTYDVSCCCQSDADRTLIYLTLYITECLKKLQKVCHCHLSDITVSSVNTVPTNPVSYTHLTLPTIYSV